MEDKLFEDENLLARLDRIPMTPTLVGLVAILSLVWLAEAFDIGIVGPVVSELKDAWHLSHAQQGLLGIASTLGVVLGMIPAGVIADRFGRRPVVLWGVAFFSVVTLLGAFVHTFWGLWLVRFVAGLGEGAVIPMPYLLLAEFVHTKRRAVSVGYSNGFLTAAYVVPTIAAVWALHRFPADVAWRVPFVMGALPLVLLIPLWLWLPESPRFLLKRGRREEVRRLVERLEDEAGLPHDTTLINRRALVVIHKGANRVANLKLLFKPPYIGRGLLVALQLMGALVLFYIVLTFGATMLQDRGFQADNSILFTGMMMVVGGLGSVLEGYLADSWGRKRVLSLYFLLAGVGCGLFALAQAPAWVLLAAFLTSFFGLGVFPVSKICVSEQFPTRLRGEGVYFSEMFARLLSGVVTLYFIPALLAAWGNRLLFAAIGIALLVLALPFVVFGRETAWISIEEAGTDISFEELEAEANAVLHGAKAPVR